MPQTEALLKEYHEKLQNDWDAMAAHRHANMGNHIIACLCGLPPRLSQGVVLRPLPLAHARIIRAQLFKVIQSQAKSGHCPWHTNHKRMAHT